MQRFFRLLIWDALYCIVPTVGYAALSILTNPNATYIITLIVFAVCAAFLSQLSRWGSGGLTLLLVALPGIYLALAPFLAPLLNGLPVPFDFVPAILLLSKTELLRQCGALAAGFALWQNIHLRVP